ncbi:MAG: 9-O-acetyl-N-acetylneuraminate esterase, partial [Eubacterium sp.]|nr:9-O-acetyl-N-acetylneuraminate esterase [Eubacterium sp.]
VVSLDFQGIGNAGFATEEKFVQEFCRLIWSRRHVIHGIPGDLIEFFRTCKESPEPVIRLGELFDHLTDWFAESVKPVVLIIDEVDSASNNQVFLDFLAQLRLGYISRDTDGIPAFHSVILAGVTDIKHLKSKIRDDSETKVNSPWNIATDFHIDMSLSEDGIRGMLDEYENDHQTGMDTGIIAKKIREYTNGYPFLVSRICELIDTTFVPDRFESLDAAWTGYGIDEAVKDILSEDNTLFKSLSGKLSNFPELRASLKSILMEGESVAWNAYQDDIALMSMYGFIRNDKASVRIDNRIFETWLYNLFISDEYRKGNAFISESSRAGSIFVDNGKLDVRLILERFVDTYHSIYGDLKERFKEKDGRELFLLYLKPIINGTGNYYIEAQTRDQRRTDVIIDYLGQQYIIELKIWRGERYNAEGEKQISDYLDYFGLDTGYMLSFNFNKNKETGVKQVELRGKTLYEATV